MYLGFALQDYLQWTIDLQSGQNTIKHPLTTKYHCLNQIILSVYPVTAFVSFTRIILVPKSENIWPPEFSILKIPRKVELHQKEAEGKKNFL